MKALLVLALSQFFYFGYAQNGGSDTYCYNDNSILYFDVDELPRFQSNYYDTMMEYIYSNIEYPSEVDVQGKVIISFVATKDVKIEQIIIEKNYVRNVIML